MQFNTTLTRVAGLFKIKSAILLAFCFITAATFAQPYVNGNLSTGATSSNGTAAPAGKTWSEVQNGNINAGFSASITNGFKLGDDFTIPAGQSWVISTMEFYGYQTGFAGTTSPFNTVRVAIHSGSITGPVVFGDQTTNRFASSSNADMFRIFFGAPGTTRTIWSIVANTPVTLPSGTYWIEYATDVTGGAAHFLPASTVTGTVTQPGNNAQQWTGTAWGPLTDGPVAPGTNLQDMPFRINYALGVACSGTPNPGNTFASSQQVCSGTTVNFTTQNATTGTGITYQWQVATAVGGPYTPAPGINNGATYSTSVTATGFYRVQVSCGANVATSTPIQVQVVPCNCISPGAATICEGAIQQLTVQGTPQTFTFTSTGSTTIPSSGAATPYPNSIAVSGVPAGARVKSISLNNITHTFPSDIDAAVVSPAATPVIIFSDAIGATDLTGQSYTFDDAAAAMVSNTAVSPTGTYKPTNYTVPDNFVAPGPGSLSQATPTLASFGTGNHNGNWNLFVVDDLGGDLGAIASWSITFELLPSAVWTGGTFFTNPAATVPYVAGSSANTVYVQPSSTTTYTATIATGPCAGANAVTVTVLPRPVVTAAPASGCGPLTITPTGAVSYTFTPATGVTANPSGTFTLNPAATTTYGIVGMGNNGCSSAPFNVTVNAAPLSATIAPVAASTFQINEGFTTVLPAGWAQQNLSSPAPATATPWFQGNPASFPAFNGPTNSYAGANFAMVNNLGTISNWMFSPVVNVKTGDIISFYTRTATGAAFPDRLELRLNTTNTGVNVGTTATSVGDYTTLLLTVNPNLVAGPGTGTGTSGYPDTWTRLSATVTGVTGTVPGRFAFRYFVTNGGLSGANSDYIGIDQVEYSTPASANCANTVANLQVTINGGVGPYTVVFSNGTTQTTINNYTSGSNIQVSPAATTTYSIVSVTGANGCTLPTAGIGAPTTFVITPGPSITSQPANTSACLGGNATFTVASGPAVGNNFQWQVSTDGGTTYTNIPGATGSSYTVTGATAAQNNNRYRVIITGSCPSAVTSNGAILTVNTAAVITAQPAASITACAGAGNTITVTATGNQLTYQWQVSTNGGTSYANIANGGTYSGVTTNTLTILNATAAMQGYLYRVLVTSAGCTATTSNSTALTTVFPAPVVVISAAPIRNLFPGLTTTLTAAVSPNAAVTYQWYRNGVAVPGATSNTLVVGIDGIGTYTVAVTDVNGCSNIGRASVPSSIVIGDSVNNETLFIYPSPNNGSFQVRLFTDNNDLNNAPAVVNVYDSKGARVFTRRYTIVSGYNQMNVDLASHGKGIYRVEVTNSIGERLKTGSVYVF